ncbi:unnamed protein product [Closterium sp. NIES-65]|nr:unnamed protein product [Closterium sp. NIES-65]
MALKGLAPTIREFFLPVQYGVSVPGGAECIIHTVRSLLQENDSYVALQLDVENAFNSVKRAVFFRTLSQTDLHQLLPLVGTLYDGPSRLLVDPRLGVEHITSSRAVRQGDPLGPLLFAAAIQPTLQSAESLVPEVAVVAYADDITIVGPMDAACKVFDIIVTELAKCRLRCNITKSSAWSRSVGVEGNTELPHGLVMSTEGIRVLGSPIGTPEFCCDQIRAELVKASAPVPLIAQLHPLHALLLLSRSISRRISYLLRTTPSETLDRDEWRAWGESLVGASLAAAMLRIPTTELERSLLWRQATLPVRLGGLGIVDPISEAPAAYIASVTAARQLLHQMHLSEVHLLSRATVLLSHDWAPDPPLVNRLSAGGEDATPPEAEMDDLDALAADIPCDTLAAVHFLRASFPPSLSKVASSLPPFALLSQIYTVVPHRTTVDRELEMLQRSGSVRVIRLMSARTDIAVLLSQDYAQVVRASLLCFLPENPMSL